MFAKLLWKQIGIHKYINYIHTSHLDKFQVSTRIPISLNFTWVYSSGHFGWILVEIVWVNSRGNFLGEFSWTKCPRKFLYLGEFSWTKNVHENSWKMSTRIHPLKMSTRIPSFWKKVSTRIHFPLKFSIPLWATFERVFFMFSGSKNCLEFF